MLRLAGCICILLGMGGYGICLAQEYENCLNGRIEIEHLLSCLIGYISYEKASLTEALMNVRGKTGKRTETFVNNLLDRIRKKEGETIGEIWREESGIFEEILGQEKEEFAELMEQSGYLEREMQLRTLERYREKLLEEIRIQKEKREGRLRVYYAAGIMGGLFFCILLW